MAVAANAVLLNFLMLISYGLDGFAYAVESHGGARHRAARSAAAAESHRPQSGLGAADRPGIHPLVCPGGHWLIRHITDIPAVIAEAQRQLPWLVAIPAAGGLVLPAGRGLYRRHPGPGDAQQHAGGGVCRLLSHLVALPGMGCGGPVAAMGHLGWQVIGLTLGWLCWRLERGGRLLAGQGTAQSV